MWFLFPFPPRTSGQSSLSTWVMNVPYFESWRSSVCVKQRICIAEQVKAIAGFCRCLTICVLTPERLSELDVSNRAWSHACCVHFIVLRMSMDMETNIKTDEQGMLVFGALYNHQKCYKIRNADWYRISVVLYGGKRDKSVSFSMLLVAMLVICEDQRDPSVNWCTNLQVIMVMRLLDTPSGREHAI